MKEKKITDPNLFMKLIIVALSKNADITKRFDVKFILDYRWEVFESEETPHDYHIIGSHPIAKRLDFYLTKTVIH